MNTANIDWSGIRAAAIALNSVRDAAMRAASNLPEIEQTRFVERVNKRAYRERWLGQARALSKPNTAGAKPLSNNVQTGFSVIKDTLSQLGEATRTNLAKAHHKAAKHAATLPAKELMSKDKATALRLHGQGAGLVHQWEAKQQQTNVMVNVALLGIDPGEVQATARVIEDE